MATLTVGVSFTDSVTVPEITPNANSKTLTPAIRRCYDTTGCNEAFTNTLITSGSTLPDFMTFDGTNGLSVSPTIADHIGDWPLEFTQVTNSGDDQIFTAVTVTITCTITAIDDPAPPATQTYYIYDTIYTIDLWSTYYLQTPPCEWPAAEVYSWTIPVDGQQSITEIDTHTLEIQTNDKTHAGTFSIVLNNDLTYLGVTFTTQIPFTIEVIDPCTITTIHTISITTFTIILGEVATQDFTEATCQIEVDYPAFGELCGPREYLVVDDTDTAVDWIVITGDVGGPYTITASPIDESLADLTHNYFLRARFTDQALYPDVVRQQPLDVTLISATCDCTLLEWVVPSTVTDAVDVALGPATMTLPSATIDDASKLPTPGIRVCYTNGNECQYTLTWTPVETGQGALPDFVTQTGSTADLSVDPQTSSHMGIGWSITTVMNIQYTNGGMGTDSIEFVGLTYDVGCTIVSIENPTDPIEADGWDLTYTLYDFALTIDLSTIAWTQTPPCDYPAVSTTAWTNPESYVISPSPWSDFQLYVSTIDKTKLGTHTLTLVNTLEYDGATFTPEISLDITIVDPCDSTVLQSFVITPITTKNGVQITTDFTEVLDSVEVAKGIDTLCGPRTYVIAYRDDAAIDWVTHAAAEDGTADLYTITVDPTLDSQEMLHELKITCTLDLYPAVPELEVDFSVTITTPDCECNRIEWDAPAVQATLETTVKKIPSDTLTISHAGTNADSLIASPQIRVCAGSCSTTTTIASIVDVRTGTMPYWMTLDTGVITISSTSNDDVQIYEFEVTMTTPDSGDQVFETVSVKIDLCVVTHFDNPDIPVTQEYLLFALADLQIDISSPGF
jgi:hypothetical protein